MSSKCSFVMDRFFALDQNEKLPLWMTLHLLHCKECRTQVRMLTQAEKISSRDSKGSAMFSAGTISDVIARLYPEKPVKKVSLLNWGIAGIFLLFCMILLSVVSKQIVNKAVQLEIYLFIGILVSVFVMCFVTSNLDFFVKQIRKFSA